MTALVATLLGCMVCVLLTYRRETQARASREAWRRWQLGRWREQARELDARAELMTAVLRALAAGEEAVPSPVRICDLPREQILASPLEWAPGLRTYATFHDREGKA